MKYFLLGSWWFLIAMLLATPSWGQYSGTNDPGATLTYTPYASALRVGCPYRFTISQTGDPCYRPTSYAWDACPAGASVTAGGGAADNFIELTFSAPSNGASQPFGATVYLFCYGKSSTTVRAVSYIRADNVAITADAYVSQNPVCQYSPFTLTLRSAQYVSSCVWQQKSAGSTTWSDIQNSSTSNSAAGFAYTVPGLYYATAFRARLTGNSGCTTSPYEPTYYSSEIQVTFMDYANAGGVAVGTQDVASGANQGSVFVTGNTGVPIYWQYSQDSGTTWTTINQNTEELKFENITTTTLYRAATTLCGNTYFSTACTVRTYDPANDISWTEAKTFDLSGTTLTSDARTYFDKLAKPLQSQAKSLSTGRILATQPLYGKYDQAVGNTLVAPIQPTDFAYQANFVTPASTTSAPYDYTRFDDGNKINAPEAVNSTVQSTLGWYYSTNNTIEPRTPVTSFPYSRTDAMPDGSTGVSRMAGPSPSLQLGGTTADGKTHEVVQGSFPVRTELDKYAALRNSLFPASVIGAQTTTMNQAAVQQLSTDADGNTTLVFSDKEGHPVMSARPATTATVAGQPDAWMTATNTVEVGWPYSVQLPANTTLTFPIADAFACTADIMVFDSQGRWVDTGSPDAIASNPNISSDVSNYLFFSTSAFTITALPTTGGTSTTYASQQREAYPFFNFYIVGDGSAAITNNTSTTKYRVINTITGKDVAFSNNTPLAPGCYQLRIEQGAVNLTYTNRYKDLSYNFYNQKGQLVESIAPKGVQQLLQSWASTGSVPLPTYVTTLEYDQQGRQIASNETDAGRTTFVYRADGKLRFSQNAKQYITGAFSYLGYDAIGRVVEAGECIPDDKNAAFSQVLTANAAWIEDTGYGGAGLLNSYLRRDIVRTTYDLAAPERGPGEAPNTAHNLPNYIPSFLAGRVATTAKYATGQPFGKYELVSQTWFSYDELGRTQWQIQRVGDGTALTSTGGTTSPPAGSSGAPTPLVGYWRLEEGSGTTVADASGNGNTGIITGTVNWVKGQWIAGQTSNGSALSFSDNGNQGYVRAVDKPSLRMGTTLTMEAWINPTGRANPSVILSKDNEYVMYITTDAHLYCAFNNKDAANPNSGWSARQTGIVVPTNNTWTHIAVTYDKGVITAYQNGVVVSTETWGSPTIPIQASGSDLTFGGNMFYGAIDEVRLWNTVRTQAEIQADAGILQVSNSPLAGYWRIDEGSGTTVADASSNANNGLITGDVNWVPGQNGVGSALSFSDGNNRGEVSAPDAPSLRMNNTLTMEAWINATNRSYGNIILSKDNEYRMGVFSDAHVWYSIYNDDPTSANSGWTWRQTGILVATGVWTHVAITYDKGVITAYQNGVAVGSEPWGSNTASIHYAGGTFHIGKGAGGDPFFGTIDEVRVWSTVRTRDQIQADMAGTTGTSGPGTGTPIATISTAAHTVDYTYDAAGNTATVCYQKNTPAERLTHYYTYDADNRLSLVQTDRLDPASSVLANRTEHARYTYYTHGPLKRVVYGGNLQGVDYTYTAAGQLKAINDGDIQQDPGQDGLNSLVIQYPDFFGISLNYYKNDYASADVPNLSTTMVSNGGQDFVEHYNGLVSGVSWQTPGSPLNAYGYNYDYKGQLLKANYGTLDKGLGRQYGFMPDPVRYQEGNLDYDANGNIGHLQRTDGVGLTMLAGAYDYAKDSNRLNQVLNAGAPAVSYTYDAIGQVTTQRESDPTKTKYLEYEASGKVTAIFDLNNNTIARYTYDEFGKRLLQQVYPNPLDQNSYTTTTFVRDAAGRELASYVAATTASTTAPAVLCEQPIYGATRLGIYRQARDQTPAEQLYELNDQLGNTRVVFRRPTTATYTLSMEAAQVSQEKQDFPGPTATTYDNVRSPNYNHSSSSLGYSVRLSSSGIGVGPTKTIAAQRGDRFRLTAYGLYNNSGTGANVTAPTSTTSSLAPTLGGVYLATAPRTALPAEEARPAPHGVQQLLSQISLGISIPLLAKVKQSRSTQTTSATAVILGNTGNGPPPAAALQYTIYRASDHTPVGGTNGSGQAYLQNNNAVDWQPLTLDFTITQDYPVTVEISTMNADGSVAAYFDDLNVQYTPGPVIEENHYYAYGQRNEGLSWRRTDERLYGRGYQGQNTTQDAESGYTAFDLRMYDARYGRWLTRDPKHQGYSLFVGMNNNPVSNIDPDGGSTLDIIIHGSNNNKVTIDAPGKDIHYYTDIPLQNAHLTFNDASMDVDNFLTNINAMRDIDCSPGENYIRGQDLNTFFYRINVEEAMSFAHVPEASWFPDYPSALSGGRRGNNLDFSFGYLRKYSENHGYNFSESALKATELGPFFTYGNKLYNLFDAGNFLTGQAFKRMGIPLPDALLGADIYARTFGSVEWRGFFKGDSKADQRAISEGWNLEIRPGYGK